MGGCFVSALQYQNCLIQSDFNASDLMFNNFAVLDPCYAVCFASLYGAKTTKMIVETKSN